jgi:hypothetical protein
LNKPSSKKTSNRRLFIPKFNFGGKEIADER